jgi:ABC-type phosphate transport system substrate-binding protein
LVSWSGPARHVSAALAALALAVAAGGCGVSLNGASHGSTSTLASDSVSASVRLPPRPPGEVDIDGRTQGSLTVAAVAAYEGSGARVVVSNHGEAQGFAKLCRGQADIVDSQQPISPAQLSVCQAEGVQPVQIEVAAEGAVLATGGEVDVGADCLTVAQVKQIFQAGSQITNWAQLGYYNIPLRVAGPGEGGGLFYLFGSTALGAQAATLADLRGDYDRLSSEGAVRNAVTDGAAAGATSAQLHSNALASLAALQRAIGEAHGYLHEATFQVQKGIRDKRSAGAQGRDRANLARAQANLAVLLGDLPAAERYIHQTTVAAERFQGELGTIGYFSLAYYDSHQEQLRPLEIDSGSLRPRLNCIFPSARTIGDGSYPLSRQLLLTVSLQDMRRPEVESFLKFYLEQAPSLASSAEFVPIPAGVSSTEVSWLEGKRQPPVVSYPAPGGSVAGGSQTTAGSAAVASQNALLAPAGGAGDGVSAADVPTAGGHAGTASGAGETAPSAGGEASPSSAAGSQSSQPLIAGQ